MIPEDESQIKQKETISSKEVEKYKEKDEEEYDPYVHRKVENPISDYNTLINLVKGSIGTGILALPEAYKYTGLLNGFILTLLLGVFSIYTLNMLLNSMYLACKRNRVPYMDYPESFQACILMGPEIIHCAAPAAPILVHFLLCCGEFGVCSIFIIFIAITIKIVVYDLTEIEKQLEIFILITFIPFTLIMLIPNIKSSIKCTLIGDISIFFSFIIITIFFIFGDQRSDLWSSGHPYDYPLFIANVLFAIQAVNTIITVEREMKSPQNYLGVCGVLSRSILILSLVYGIIGFSSYWTFGNEIESSITYNLPQNNAWTRIVHLTYGIAIFVSYRFRGFLILAIIWTHYTEQHFNKNLLFWQYMIRFSIVLFTYAFALFIPLLGPLISLIGSLVAPSLGIIFPAIMNSCVRWPEQNLGRFYWIFIKDLFIMFIGNLCLFVGTAAAIRDISAKLNAKTS